MHIEAPTKMTVAFGGRSNRGRGVRFRPVAHAHVCSRSCAGEMRLCRLAFSLMVEAVCHGVKQLSGPLPRRHRPRNSLAVRTGPKRSFSWRDSSRTTMCIHMFARFRSFWPCGLLIEVSAGSKLPEAAAVQDLRRCGAPADAAVTRLANLDVRDSRLLRDWQIQQDKCHQCLHFAVDARLLGRSPTRSPPHHVIARRLHRPAARLRTCTSGEESIPVRCDCRSERAGAALGRRGICCEERLGGRGRRARG